MIQTTFLFCNGKSFDIWSYRIIMIMMAYKTFTDIDTVWESQEPWALVET